MAEIIIYSKHYCPYCTRAKRFFEQKGLKYTEHLMDDRQDELDALRKKTGLMTVPQIFIGSEFIGGYDDLIEAESSGKLGTLLK